MTRIPQTPMPTSRDRRAVPAGRRPTDGCERWGGRAGPRAAPSPARCGSRGTRADQGVRPTIFKAAVLRYLLVLLVAALFLGQSGNPLADPRVRRIGDNLLCLCGCGNSVTSCNMLHCHYADPARARIAGLIKEGRTDEQIWEIFARENGKQAILTPPTQGFYLINWAMPALAAALGLWIVWVAIRRLRRKPPAPVAALPEDVLERYQNQIEKEVSKLD